MKKIIQLPRKEKAVVLLSILVGLSGALLFYLSYFQKNFFSITYTVFSIILFTLIFLFSCIAFLYIKKKVLFKISRDFFFIAITTSILISIPLLLSFPAIPLFILVPDKQVSIQIPAQEPPVDTPSPVGYLYMRNSLGYISLSELELVGPWQEGLKQLLLESNTQASISWMGKTDGLVEIGFQATQYPRSIKITIDGQEHLVNLQKKSGDPLVIFKYESALTLLSLIPFYIAFPIVSFFAIFAVISLLASINFPFSPDKTKPGIINAYGLPMLITGTITILTFWPGMMTTDSITQWKEIITRIFTDLNPLFHTLLLSALVGIWHSPAIIVIFQNIVFFFVISYGLGLLQKRGVPKLILWLMALLFAFWPFNPLMVATVWKDVLYGIAQLALFIILMEVILSEGQWLEKPLSWLKLGFTGFLLASLRHNGLPVAMLTLAILPLIFRSYRKKLVLAFLFTILLWAGFKGPVKNILVTEQPPTSALDLTLLHHIAAHVNFGTSMTNEQVDYLNSIMLISGWDYECCYMGNIYTNPAFNQARYMQNSDLNRQIVFSSFMKNPIVDIKDQLCASEMTWRFLNNQCTFKSMHPYTVFSPTIKRWVQDNNFGLTEASKLPSLIPFYRSSLERIGTFSGTLTPMLRPAFYFYLSITAIVAACIRLKNKKILVLLIPVLLQTGILALINFAPAFRYQYGICIIGLFSLGLLFLRDNSSQTK